MLKELSGGWAHSKLEAELVTMIGKRLSNTHVEVQHGFNKGHKVLGSILDEAVVCGHYYPTNKKREQEKEMRKEPYRIKMLNSECGLASWNGDLRVQSSYTRQPKDRFGVVGLLLHQFR